MADLFKGDRGMSWKMLIPLFFGYEESEWNCLNWKREND